MGICYMTQGTQTGALQQPRGVEWGGRWEGVSRGRGQMLYLWLIHVHVWQKPTKFCKATILQLKKERNVCTYQTRSCELLAWPFVSCCHP